MFKKIINSKWHSNISGPPREIASFSIRKIWPTQKIQLNTQINYNEDMIRPIESWFGGMSESQCELFRPKIGILWPCNLWIICIISSAIFIFLYILSLVEIGRKLEEKITYFSITFITVLATISNGKNTFSWSFEKEQQLEKREGNFAEEYQFYW